MHVLIYQLRRIFSDLNVTVSPIVDHDSESQLKGDLSPLIL